MTRKRKCSELHETCGDDLAGQSDESETGGPRARKASADKSPAAAEGKMASNMAIAAAKEMGLCATCDNRETCVFPNAGKDIHLCEEYQ